MNVGTEGKAILILIVSTTPELLVVVGFILLWHRYRYRFGCLRVWSDYTQGSCVVVVVVVVVRFVSFERW